MRAVSRRLLSAERPQPAHRSPVPELRADKMGTALNLLSAMVRGACGPNGLAAGQTSERRPRRRDTSTTAPSGQRLQLLG